MNTFKEAIGCIFTLAVFGFICSILLGGYIAYDKMQGKTIESKTLIKPDYRLKVRGKVVDTVYIYKLK
jgi:hypothetical protein